MLNEIKGVVIRETNINESDKLLTVFTDNGTVPVTAKGVRSIKSKNMPACQMFCYSTFTLYEKNGYYWAKEASLINNFFDIRLSVERTAIASYICEAIDYTATSEPSDEYLSVVLNSLYALSLERYSPEKIKAVFELRVSSLLGFTPDIDACRSCKQKKERYTLDIMNGSLICSECKKIQAIDSYFEQTDENGFRYPVVNITDPVREAMRYVIHCKPKDILNFNIPPEDMQCFVKAAEAYFINQIDHGFKTLDFYYSIK
ncbi:MAG: DNA repair protein RecO [Clostridia bacterium]|nr:DNA repair protein RecO [Clostridia bacterium]